MGERTMGTVKWFNDAKGYGFIEPDPHPGDVVFVHHTQIIGEGYRHLNDGERVEFSIVSTERNDYAENVARASGSGEERE